MSRTITHDDKFHRRFLISSIGDVVDAGSKLSNGIGNLLTAESHLRITTEGLGSNNQIEVRAKLAHATNFTTLTTITGNTTTLVDITSYEIVHFYVTNYDSSQGYLIVTGFVKNTPPGQANTITIGDQNSNLVDLVDIGGNYAVPVVSSLPATAPTIYNIPILLADLNVEKSQVILNGTSKILIKHRNKGNIHFSFVSGFSSYIELPGGNSYNESDLNLQGRTLYFRTDKIGTIEILIWT